MRPQLFEKLEILADAAKYDASCASSGSSRPNTPGGIGNGSGWGICHSFTADGRCVSLLKLLFTNHCIYDCAYCVSRRSNDVPRKAFTVQEVVDLTMGFYRRNYIEGLFLSSGVFRNADYTTERLVRVARELRRTHRFNGYIHLKVIPGSSPELLEEAGLYADRLSVNLEIASEPELVKVAPEKDHASVLAPMGMLKTHIARSKEERKTFRSAPLFAPGGQSTQLVIGATPESDRTVLQTAGSLYRRQGLKRVYYSGYVPVGADRRLPVGGAPLLREHRLYQADWLFRFYAFEIDEIVDDETACLDLEVDPKLAWALRHPARFPVDVNTADYEDLLRVPGLGVRSAQRIVTARRHGRLRWEHLRRLGVVLKRARYFITLPGHRMHLLDRDPAFVRRRLTQAAPEKPVQLTLFGAAP